jgi:hypothetical protein
MFRSQLFRKIHHSSSNSGAGAMFARNLETFLRGEFETTGLHHRPFEDISQRFETLRGYRLLPQGRDKYTTVLTLNQIVAGVLALVTQKPGFAGLSALTLKDLRPVGETAASFEACASFGDAIGVILSSPVARKAVLEVRISDSEIYTNAHGRASIEYLVGDSTRTAHYVMQNAVLLTQPGGEINYNPCQLISSVVTETVLLPIFFDRLAQAVGRKYLTPPPDPDDLAEEERKEARIKKLEIVRGSTFLNMAVDNHVTWPSTETIVEFEGKKLILMPPTRDETTSLHIDLFSQRLTAEEASTLMNRFLSLLAWCDDHHAVLQEGWSGNPVPVPVPKRNPGFATAYTWIFDRKLPASAEARKALALYREGCNAEESHLVSFAVLSFYKIIELRYKGKSEARTWFGDNFTKLRSDETLTAKIDAFEAACGTEKVHDHLYRACRTAVAHANKPFSSDPDEYTELKRLKVAADILRPLARLFIRDELGVSDCPYDGS